MSATISVLYPAASDATFNMDYYTKTHMPLVMDTWGSEGMTGYKVVKMAGTATGDAAPYTVLALLHFQSLQQFQTAAQGPNAQKVMGDIPNFSNKEPVILIGEVTSSHGSQA